MILQAYLGQNNHNLLLFGFERPEVIFWFFALYNFLWRWLSILLIDSAESNSTVWACSSVG